MIKHNKKNSIKIGTFERDFEGTIHGRIFGLGMGVTSVAFEPQTSKDGKSYFRVIADPAKDALEIGAAFPKEKDGLRYHSVTWIPALPLPIKAALFKIRTPARSVLFGTARIADKPRTLRPRLISITRSRQLRKFRHPSRNQPGETPVHNHVHYK